MEKEPPSNRCDSKNPLEALFTSGSEALKPEAGAEICPPTLEQVPTGPSCVGPAFKRRLRWFTEVCKILPPCEGALSHPRHRAHAGASKRFKKLFLRGHHSFGAESLWRRQSSGAATLGAASEQLLPQQVEVAKET